MISIEANIAAGKSTFLDFLAQSGASVVHEPLDKWQNVAGFNLLDMYYQNPEMYSFIFQMYVLETHDGTATFSERSVQSSQMDNYHLITF